jgi:hypothetical protein
MASWLQFLFGTDYSCVLGGDVWFTDVFLAKTKRSAQKIDYEVFVA